MTRKYNQALRAEKAAETRLRIAAAAVELHSTIGPAQTTISMVAERAGVQRHTVYAHFPTEHDLQMACSGLALERDPLPDPKNWAEIADPADQLRAGIGALWDWFARNADLTGLVLRDAEYHEITRDIIALRMDPYFGKIRQALGASLDEMGRKALLLAISFFTWRTLVKEGGLPQDKAIELMIDTIMPVRPGEKSAARDQSRRSKTAS